MATLHQVRSAPPPGTDPGPGGAVLPGADLLAALLAGTPEEEQPVTHVHRMPVRESRTQPWPEWVGAQLRERLETQGVQAPYRHQVEAAELAHDGRHVVVATGTASGKSLAYQVPALTRLAEDPRACVLYLAPTKALARDQLAALADLADPSVRPAAYDGDTPMEEREWVRRHSRWIVTNPDMLHRGVLPAHQKWSSTLRRLAYVVVDECHAYRGVFGSHVGHVLRRLRRICRRYGAEPVFLLASATVAEPAEAATRLVGAPVVAVTEDGSPRPGATFALWEPPLTERTGEHGAPLRRSAAADAATLLADLVERNARTLAFVRSRRSAESVADQARHILRDRGRAELARRVDSYRGGYLPEERRELERALSSGELLGVATTNALELGIDIAGLDAVVLAGYPGTLASLWQQAGRAGRAQRESLVVFVARDDPLDHYLAHHPRAVFGRPVEATVTDPTNPYVLGPQLCCAAAELPLVPADLPDFGGPPAEAQVAELVATGLLRRRPTGWYWAGRGRPDVDIRGSGLEPVTIIEGATGRLLGTVDGDAAHATVHTGALYVHRGETYVVDEFCVEDATAVVHPESPEWTTVARDVTDLAVVSTDRSWRLGTVTAHTGVVDVTNQVVAYQRRRLGTGEVLAEFPLDLPPRQLRTRAVWLTLDEQAVARAEVDEIALPGSLHAAEHAAIGILPLLATCDRWDLGGVSTALHPDTGAATIVVYDGHPGGAGFAERGFAVLRRWLQATRATVASCECESGCPSCVQSPKCGNGNDPLDKGGAVRVLDVVLDELAAAEERGQQPAADPAPGGAEAVTPTSGVPSSSAPEERRADGAPPAGPAEAAQARAAGRAQDQEPTVDAEEPAPAATTDADTPPASRAAGGNDLVF
ncbi:DEAD/DEAH box helicase [Geodermatophilus sabuli]|uniref:DEAD/DEAH box helicase domain-containing protein n=1 Tax=Geodermatophilus sabuli TaxID=1564158 RepID=A0A285EFJ2_9ACTN|nr:DEAD/DEAH box helicase [Geodermatophilus sabuli]MBB3083444.1 DEAD/DEAH box helicase domain-containing protein [Geodermatophilus sabuli]SNX96836.1 DEAD/DEAH box helicase domain-containing protein [Geodermatophilus sabuli]